MGNSFARWGGRSTGCPVVRVSIGMAASGPFPRSATRSRASFGSPNVRSSAAPTGSSRPLGRGLARCRLSCVKLLRPSSRHRRSGRDSRVRFPIGALGLGHQATMRFCRRHATSTIARDVVPVAADFPARSALGAPASKGMRAPPRLGGGAGIARRARRLFAQRFRSPDGVESRMESTPSPQACVAGRETAAHRRKGERAKSPRQRLSPFLACGLLDSNVHNGGHNGAERSSEVLRATGAQPR